MEDAKQRSIDEAIVNALIEATPEWWKAATLCITRHQRAPGIEGFQHAISSPEGHRDLVQATQEMFAATFQLADLFKRHGRSWVSVTYSASQDETGAWNYSAEFGY